MTSSALAIDPGTSKCGMALVERVEDNLNVIWQGIVPTEQLADRVAELLDTHKFRLVIVGNGTKSQSAVHAIRERLPSMGILVIDERDTTLQARERYWSAKGRRGWRRLLPSTLQVPPEPFDDFVALILAERVLLA